MIVCINMSEHLPWSERKKEYHREYQRRRKAKSKAAGICPNCEKRPAAENKVCCSQCLEDKKLYKKFGTAADFRLFHAELFERQAGLCGICRSPMRRPVLDHCHKTMAVRGLLCSNCNVGLGQFKDNSDILMNAIQYIKTNGGVGVFIKKRETKTP